MSYTTLHNACMDRTDAARLDWQRAQADLQTSVAELEKRVAETADPGSVLDAREAVARKQRLIDELLNRYITQLGKMR